MPPFWSHDLQTLKPAVAWAVARWRDVRPFASRMASVVTPSRRSCARCFPDRTMLSCTFPSALICWSTMSYPADDRRPAVAASTVAEYMASPTAGWSFAVAGAIADKLRTTPKTSAYRRRMGPSSIPPPGLKDGHCGIAGWAEATPALPPRNGFRVTVGDGWDGRPTRSGDLRTGRSGTRGSTAGEASDQAIDRGGRSSRHRRKREGRTLC